MQAMMVPLAILSIPCKFVKKYHLAHPKHDDVQSTETISILVAEAGLGKDIWNLDPDQITRILYVRIILPSKGVQCTSGLVRID